jgi:hypothetical protein
MKHTKQLRIHLAIAFLIGLSTGILYVQHIGSLQDLHWPVNAARRLMAGEDPYTPIENTWPVNLMTTVLIVLPLSWLPDGVIAALFVGLASSLLVWGILRSGNPYVLLVFLSLPYMSALHYAQWSILIGAVWYLPALLPLTLAKPQIGIPVALAHWRWRRGTIVIATLLVATTFLVYPTWIGAFLSQIGSYDGRIPATVLPFGPFLLLLALRWRNPQAQLLLLLALMPQRAYYDLLLPLLAAPGPVSLLMAVIGSWAVQDAAWSWIVPGIYLPLVIGHLVGYRADQGAAAGKTGKRSSVP